MKIVESSVINVLEEDDFCVLTTVEESLSSRKYNDNHVIRIN